MHPGQPVGIPRQQVHTHGDAHKGLPLSFSMLLFEEWLHADWQVAPSCEYVEHTVVAQRHALQPGEAHLPRLDAADLDMHLRDAANDLLHGGHFDEAELLLLLCESMPRSRRSPRYRLRGLLRRCL